MIENINTVLDRNKNDIIKVLMGDFNTDAISNEEGYKKILEQGLYDTYEMAKIKDNGITVDKNIDGWKSNDGKMRIDYIFSNKELEVLESNVIFNGENRQIVSDHYGVEVILNV